LLPCLLLLDSFFFFFFFFFFFLAGSCLRRDAGSFCENRHVYSERSRVRIFAQLASRREQRKLRVTASTDSAQKEAELPSIELPEAYGYTVAQMRAAVANSLLAAST